jgi:predicted ATPase/class 3 adenylate cyclase
MPDLPSGTVTFLFTDIEGSTVLWERDRAAMREAVDRQLAILQSLITAHHGVLYKTVGDGTQAAFASAEEALRAAVASQRALLVEDWGEIGPLRVRMALHAGEAIPDAHGDYLAAPLNRLARLLSTGYGGQILLAQTVQQLTRGALPAGTELRDLGEHRLRDLLEPERVYQLRHPELPDQFPPLKSLESRPNNLPRQPTPFLGRERETSDVVSLLQRNDVHLLTLGGPGGTGKTRLALQAAADLLDDFADGVFFVPLASLTDPALVLSTIASTLGVHEEGGQPLAERFRDFLVTKQLLLVLDNLEHLVDAAPAIGELLATSPRLKVLATSRMPLRLRGEREYPVPSLGLPRRKPPPPPEQLSQYEAVRLFIDRAQAVKPDFTISNENAPALAEICHRLDGLPLAIELAAARVRMLPPPAMLARLEQRLPLLTGGARDAPARQQTLRNTIAWSYDLLEPEEQQLFRRLAVFAGGASFEAVEAVANPDGTLEVFGGLERLLEHSLLRQEEGPEGEPRFGMLETIREFGLEHLEGSREAEETRRRHADVMIALAEDAALEIIQGARQGVWLDRLEAEHDNIRSALAWMLEQPDGKSALRVAAALARFWAVRGNPGEGREWLRRALVVGREERTVARAWALRGAGLLAETQGDYGAAQALLEECLALAQALPDQAVAAAWHHLGNVASDHSQAAACYEQALGLRRELGDTSGTGRTLANLAQVSMEQGHIDRAEQFLAEAMGLFEHGADTYGTANAILTHAALERLRGNVERAEKSYQNALRLGRELDDKPLMVETLMELAEMAQARGDRVRALAAYREVLALARELGDKLRVATVLVGLAALAAASREAVRGARLLGAADGLRRLTGVPLLPDQEELRERVEAMPREALDKVTFADAKEAGGGLPLEAAVSDALALADALTAMD